ncbi:MAG: MFS transporter [Eggerthellaceae bacterium]|nr:MFS transporter [Eggerthellaceae bacterium]
MAETTQPISASGRILPQRWLSIIVVIWVGQAAAMVTAFSAGYAAIWYVTETTGSALMLAAMGICTYLPQGLLSPLCGVAADRFNRKAVMIVSGLGIGVVSLVLGFVILLGHATIGLIMVVMVARGVGQAFRIPAMMAAMPMLVPEKHLLRINTLDSLLVSVANIGAPALGILLYTTVGLHSVMFLDFVGALVAVGGLLLVKIPTTHDASGASRSAFANLRDGALALAATRGLVVLIIGLGLGMVVVMPMGSLFPLMTFEHFHGDGYMASISEAAFGIGLLVGSGTLIAWGGGKRLAVLIMAAALIVGATTAAIGLLDSSLFAGFVALAGVMGVAWAGFNGPLVTLIQRHVPEEKMGRALGLNTAMLGLASPVGLALGGVLAEAIGVAPFFVIDGIACFAIGAAIYSFKSVRALDKGEG